MSIQFLARHKPSLSTTTACTLAQFKALGVVPLQGHIARFSSQLTLLSF